MGRRRWIRLYKIRLLQPQDITVQARRKIIQAYKRSNQSYQRNMSNSNFINAKEYVIKHGSKNAQAGEHNAFDFTRLVSFSIPYQNL